MSAALASRSFHPRDVISIVLGGGAGTRLFPLTKDRAKPAVPLAAKYRLVDIPISNCINSNLKRVFLLTQYQSSSLHRHIQMSYQFDDFSQGFVELMAAQQTEKSHEWYQGTADACRQNLSHFNNHYHQYVLILCGDQIYRMNYEELIQSHIDSGADVTVATIPVKREATHAFGIMEIDKDTRRIVRFVEKPKDPKVVDTLAIPKETRATMKTEGTEDLFLASMGIYVFNRDVFNNALDSDHDDFGKHIIPGAIKDQKVNSYIFEGYWEDVGTIAAFYEANLDLARPKPKFDFYDLEAPIYTRSRYLPASRILDSKLQDVVVADGCVVTKSSLKNCVIGLRSRIDEGSTLEDCVLLGHDYFETEEMQRSAQSRGKPAIGIGKNCKLSGVIVDKNARIGNNVTITAKGKEDKLDGDGMYYVRDGVVIIPKKSVVPDGTVI